LAEEEGSGRGTPTHSESPSPWSKRAEPLHKRRPQEKDELGGAIPEAELHDIADESSQTERRADDAERELMEWKKLRFMQDRVGEDFDALIISVTKFGFFVELMDMFIEGLVPLTSLTDDRYTYRENTRQIIGERTRKKYSLGDRVRVLLDRIDRTQRKLQFAVLEEAPSRAQKRHRRR
jgi:ribonuclease R